MIRREWERGFRGVGNFNQIEYENSSEKNAYFQHSLCVLLLQRIQILVDLLRWDERLLVIRELLKRSIKSGIIVEWELRLLERERIVLEAGSVLAEAWIVCGWSIEILVRVSAGLGEALLRVALLWKSASETGTARIAWAGAWLLTIVVGVRKGVAGAVAVCTRARARRWITCL